MALESFPMYIQYEVAFYFFFFIVMSLVSESLFVKTEVKQQCNVEPLQEERLDVNNIRIPFLTFFLDFFFF